MLPVVNITNTDAFVPKPDQNVSPNARFIILYLHTTILYAIYQHMLTAAFHKMQARKSITC